MTKLFLLLLSLFWLVACGHQPEPVPATAVFGDPSSIQLLIPSNDFALDSPRELTAALEPLLQKK